MYSARIFFVCSRSIIVDGASDVTVYGIDGKIHGIGHENAVIAVEPGFYVVKADGKAVTAGVR